MNRKLILFVVFAFLFAGLLVIIQIAAKIDFEIIVLPQLAPTLAYLLTILLFRDMYKPIIIKFNKYVLVKTFIAVLFPLTIFTITCIIGSFIGIQTKIPGNLFQIIIVGIIGLIIGCITEEIGWRSFLQPALEQKYPVFISSLIVGLIWGLWHVSYYSNGLIFMLGFLVFTISVSVIIVFLQKNTHHSLIISALFHISINIGAKFFGNNDSLNMINNLVWLTAAIVITIFGRKYYFVKAAYTAGMSGDNHV